MARPGRTRSPRTARARCGPRHAGASSCGSPNTRCPFWRLRLLSSIALWPEISHTIERGRATWHRLIMVDPTSGTMKRPHYRGFDGQNQPYTVVADSADRVSAGALQPQYAAGRPDAA